MNVTKKTNKLRLLILLLVLRMIATLLPVMPMTAFAEGTDTGKAIQLVDSGTAANIDGYDSTNGYDYIYYGTWNDSAIRWRVLDTKTNMASDGLFLLSDALLGTGTNGEVRFDNFSRNSNAWQGSVAQGWCRDFAGESGASTKVPGAFTGNELAAILATTKSDDDYTSSKSVSFAAENNILNGDKVFFLSAEEAENGDYGFTNDSSRSANYVANSWRWWLRSSRAGSDSQAGFVDYDGDMNSHNVNTDCAARPAFNLNLSSVLFTSAAEGGKSATVGSTLTSVTTYGGDEWKLTLKDSTRSAFTASLNASSSNKVAAGGSVSIDYSGAETGDNEYISAMLIDDSGNVLYYGNIVKDSASGTNQAITIPADLAAGSYKLKIFNEQINGDKKTDYASEFNNIEITVTAGGGTTAATELTTVDVSGITLPEVGEAPNYDVTLPEGANYHLATAEELRNLGWTDLDIQGLTNGMRWETASYSLLSSSDSFETDEEYHFTVALLPNSGYTFSDNQNATLNGSTDILWKIIDRGALWLVFSTDLKATGAGGGTTTTYGVWVDGTQVTSDNKDDILKNGTAFYDSDNQTLTLNNYVGGAIRANHILTVTLADGSENIVTNPEDKELYCISANNNNLTINGSGDLKVVQYRYNCSAISTNTYGGNLLINMTGNLNVTNYSWHGLYAFGSLTISGSGDVSIYNEESGTGIVSGTDDIILSGRGKLTVDAHKARWAARLKTSGKSLLLNGTGAPLSFSAGTGYAAIYNEVDKTSPVGGTNLAYYNKVMGASDTASVVYEHNAEPLTIEIPISKQVFQNGKHAPGAKTFEFEVKPYGNPQADISLLTITGTTIETNGASTYPGTIKIVGPEDVINNAQSFAITEKNDGAENWSYDTTSYIVYPDFGNGMLIQKDRGTTTLETVQTAEFYNSYRNNTMTVEIPFSKTVVQGGNVAPGTKTFEFEVKPHGNPRADISLLTITGTTIEMNGANTYTGTIKIVGPEDVINNAQSFAITEKNDGAENWSYDTTSYIVYPDFGNDILIQKDMGPNMNPNSVPTAEFTNTYTKNEAPAQTTYTLTTSVNGVHGTISAGKTGLAENTKETVIFTPDSGYEIDKVTVNGVETGVLSNVLDVTMNGNKTVVVTYKKTQGGNSGGSGQTTSPQTGDNSNMLLWIALLLTSCGGIVTTVVFKRKRVRSK